MKCTTGILRYVLLEAGTEDNSAQNNNDTFLKSAFQTNQHVLITIA